MKLKIIIICLIFFGLVNLNAQELNSQSSHIFSAAYFGETFAHPGFSFSYNKSLKTWKKVKTKKSGKEKIRVFNLSWSNKYSFYHHDRNHNGNILATGLDFSYTKKKGWFYQFGLFTGSNLRYFNEDVFIVNENNQVEKISFANNLVFIYGLKTAFGKNIRFKKSPNLYSIYLGSNLFDSIPFGTSSTLSSAIELGIRYHL